MTKLVYGTERRKAIFDIALALAEANIKPDLSRSLVDAWNERNCIPPLTRDIVELELGYVEEGL